MSDEIPEDPQAVEEWEASLPTELDAETREFINRFAEARASVGGKPMNGQVLGLLIISDEPCMSANRIATLLGISSGAVSMATRDLLQVGFIVRHTIPGVRRKFYRVEDDVWGSFLEGERDYLRRISAALQSGLETRLGSRPGPAKRLRNGSRYMAWVEQHHRRSLQQWREYRDRTDDE